MKTSESITEIANAVINFQGLMPTLPKSASGYNYKYTPLDLVVETITPIMKDAGLGYVQFPSNESESGVSLTTRLIHKSGEWMQATMIVPIPQVGKANAAQVYGAALTYARRYALTAMLGIVADEDVDARTFQKENAAKNKNPAQSPSLPQPPKKNAKNPSVKSLAPAKLKQLNTVGSGKYGKDWDTKRPELVNAITKGRSKSSKDLTAFEAEKLINGMS